jgi:GH35 family endo-1,4-beta-xylanase
MFARLSVLLTLALSVAAATAAKKPAQNTLKGAAGSRYFATALGLGHLTNASDPEFATLARDQFSGATPENEMKWCVHGKEQ